jgi:3-methyladenine DNA glycosylase AlkC
LKKWYNIRNSTTYTLIRLEVTESQVFTALIKIFKDKDSDVRKSTVQILERLKVTGPQLITTLIKTLEDQET